MTPIDRRTVVVAMVLFACMSFAQTETQSQSEEQQVISVERALFQALKNQDAKALAPLLTQDFLFRNAGDDPIGKDAFLKAATSVEGTILSVTSDDMRVQIHGELAVLSGTQKAVVRLKDGKQVTGIGVFTDVFAKRSGRWLLIFAHNVDLPDQAEAPSN